MLFINHFFKATTKGKNNQIKTNVWLQNLEFKTIMICKHCPFSLM